LYGPIIGPFFDCHHCQGPILEAMQACPWCGATDHSFREITRYPLYCPDCERGIAADWRFCPWCFGAGFQNPGPRRQTSRRGYEGRCQSPSCRGPLPAYARYCPWCRAKVRRKWKLAGLGEGCQHCGWEVARDFWQNCAWCGDHLHG
jgi:hypothetical protein